jgi:hypothetical protein
MSDPQADDDKPLDPGATEIRTFDLRSLRQTGRLRFATEP